MTDVLRLVNADVEANAAWRLLLPATVAGPVALVDLEPGTAAGFRRSYPTAVIVSTDCSDLRGTSNAVYWDGRHWPLREGALALLVVDERRVDSAALAKAVKPGGCRAAIVSARRPHNIVPYPQAEAVQRLLRSDWPASTHVPGQRLKERLAASPLWRLSGRAGFAIDSDAPSIVDDVVADLGSALDTPATLQGFMVSGGDNVILRVSLSGPEAALRLSLTELGTIRLAQQRRVLAGIEAALRTPDLRTHMPRELANGETHGLPWRAETWHQGQLGAGGRSWRGNGPGWEVAHDLGRLLCDTAPTGHAPAGWADAWVCGMDQFGAGVESALSRAVYPVEQARLPTAWCHGDLWPGNIVLGNGPAIVLDWEQGRREAPVGLDSTFVELSRLGLASKVPIGHAAARALRDPAALASPPQLMGVSWAEAAPALRAAYVVAAFVIHAIGPEGDRRGYPWAQKNLSPVLSALTAL